MCEHDGSYINIDFELIPVETANAGHGDGQTAANGELGDVKTSRECDQKDTWINIKRWFKDYINNHKACN